MTDIKIAAKDGGSFTGYLAKPGKAKAPGLVLIQEIFGVNAVMRRIADDYAQQGYLVLCPDLFWRQEPGIQITDAEMERAFGLYQKFDSQKGVGDLMASVAALRSHPDCNGKVGCVGYCLGGSLAYVMAANSDVDASVSYYGIGIAGMLEMAGNIKKPLMMHIAEEDSFVPKAEQETIKQTLAANKRVTIHSYPGKGHAFARVGGQPYDKEAADLANKRTADFLKANLG
jgi:carboxymethylenebutenolidase